VPVQVCNFLQDSAMNLLSGVANCAPKFIATPVQFQLKCSNVYCDFGKESNITILNISFDNLPLQIRLQSG
jgi:hypothetical protein